MTIESVEHRENETVFGIHEPTRNGEADIHREITVSHKPEELAKLPAITGKEISELPNDIIGTGIVESVVYREKLPTGDTLVFIRHEDHSDWDSNTYRLEAYSIKGPYRLVEDEVQKVPSNA